jgi:hypothetical protein
MAEELQAALGAARGGLFVKPRRMTPEIERALDNEAYRRARGDHLRERTPTKVLVRQTGLSHGYIANVIAKKRHAYEIKIHITTQHGTNVKS